MSKQFKKHLNVIIQKVVIGITLLFIGICAIPVCLFLGLIAAAWGASESILKYLEKHQR